MDKKNTFIGLILLVAGFGLMIYTTPTQPPAPVPAPAPASDPREPGGSTEIPLIDIGNTDSLPETERSLEMGQAPISQPTTAPASQPSADFRTAPQVRLESELFAVDFSPIGAAITRVIFKQTDPRSDADEYVFNQGALHPALALYFDRAETLVPFLSEFQLETQTANRVQFRWDSPRGNYAIRRTFSIQPDSYIIQHSTELINKGDSPLRLSDLFFGIGTAMPLASDPAGQYLNVAIRSSNKLRKIDVQNFTGSDGFLGFGSRAARPSERQTFGDVDWMAVKNQYFTSIIIPARTMDTTVHANGVPYRDSFVAGSRSAGVFGATSFPSPEVAPRGKASIDFGFYVGPKEYTRLRTLDHDAEMLMEFGSFFGGISELLLLIMSWFNSWVHNWGLAIVLLTLSIKLIFWPLTSKGIRSQKLTAKRMQGIAEPMKALREKYAADPSKMQKEMMALYQKYNVNPLAAVAGCLPILIQMPIFFGLFGMLRTASELRLAPFLWISDLSQPDRIFVFSETLPLLGGFALNILPILYGLTSYLQMKMTPMPESMDEQQIMMQKMFRIMPWIFVVFLYNFAAALSLYWIANNLLSMLQLYMVNRSVQPELDKIDEEMSARRASEATPVKPAAAAGKKRPRKS